MSVSETSVFEILAEVVPDHAPQLCRQIAALLDADRQPIPANAQLVADVHQVRERVLARPEDERGNLQPFLDDIERLGITIDDENFYVFIAGMALAFDALWNLAGDDDTMQAKVARGQLLIGMMALHFKP